MRSSKILLSDLDAFSQWTATLWFPKEGFLTTNDYAVMGLGLSGETGEVMEAIEECQRAAEVSPGLVKELGDALYYWARILDAFKLRLSFEEWIVMYSEVGFEQAVGHCSALTRATGQVSEVLKKLLRDGVSPENEATFRAKLLDGLENYLRAWHFVVSALELDPLEVMRVNRQKLEDRNARGVMAGSGNHR